jgi:peptidoglycan/xylan/chitin deacetylase (PgdA/CDA1 family)
MKTHGDRGWEKYPSYLEILVPRVLDFLKSRNLTITFFIVGQDAALEENHDMLRAIAAAGHEIGNHSFKHEPWLHFYSEQEIATEIALAEEHIERVTGRKPIGFRGPGFSLSAATLQQLKRRGYLYDASAFPNLIMPVARAYYFLTARFTPEEKQQRKVLGGTMRDGLRPIKPYRWQMEDGSIIEIPVTTMPVLKIPIHVSYLLCLSLFSHSLARWYLNGALRLCRLTGTQPSLLLHPTDFLGCDDTKDLSFFPAMNLPSAKKIEMVSDFLQLLCTRFAVVTLQQHAQAVAQATNLPNISPDSHPLNNGRLFALQQR